jgi:sugar phosphate isomerase/epimerase
MSEPPTEREFFTCLNTAALEIRVSFPESMRFAGEYGFEGVVPETRYLAGLEPDERRRLRRQLVERNLRWGSLRVPVDVTGDEAAFAEGMKGLPGWSAVAEEAGVERTHMTLSAGSNQLTRDESFARHVERYNQITSVLKDHGLRLGLEYMGPLELRAELRYPFINTLPELVELLRAVDNHLGVILDSFHWYTAGDTVSDILALSAENVISVDINDAIAGVSRDDQEDLNRALPGTTGVIDISGFLGALVHIGYDGPVCVEPFCKELAGKSPDEILTMTKKSIAAVLPAAG